MNPEKIEPAAGDIRPDDCAHLLSCLLDGELEERDCAALLERLRHDPQAARHWAMLNLSGDALRSSEVAAWHSEAFASRMASALDKEPTVLAPVAARPQVRRWLLPAAGVAAAAAVLVVVGLPSQHTLQPAASAVTAQASRAVSSAPVRAAATVAPQIDRLPALEQYLTAHRELAGPSLMPNSTPYLRTSGALDQQEQR